MLLRKMVTEEGSQVPGQLLISLDLFNLMSFSWGSPGLRGTQHGSHASLLHENIDVWLIGSGMILPRDGPGSVL